MGPSPAGCLGQVSGTTPGGGGGGRSACLGGSLGGWGLCRTDSRGVWEAAGKEDWPGQKQELLGAAGLCIRTFPVPRSC